MGKQTFFWKLWKKGRKYFNLGVLDDFKKRENKGEGKKGKLVLKEGTNKSKKKLRNYLKL